MTLVSFCQSLMGTSRSCIPTRNVSKDSSRILLLEDLFDLLDFMPGCFQMLSLHDFLQ